MTGGLGKLSRYLLAGVGAIGLLAVGTPEAKATDVQQLEQTLRAVQEQVKQLQREVASAKAAAASAQSAAAKAGSGGGGDDLDLKVKWRGAPEFSSADGKFKAKVRGRIEADYQKIDQDTARTFAPDVSATNIRRARLGLEGVLFYDFKYVIEVDFAGNGTSVQDAYIDYAGLPLGIRLGNFRQYNSLEQLTSGNVLTFMERAAFIEAFEIGRYIGGGLYYNENKHYTLSAGIFGESISSTPLFEDYPGDENRSFSARATVAPINEEGRVLHFGASFRDRDLGNDQNYLQYRARAADESLANRFVQTGRISDGDTLWGLEAAGVFGPVYVSGEYAKVDVDLVSGATLRTNPPEIPARTNPFIGTPSPSYDGWYIDAGVFLTGETRPYKDGVWQRVKVKNPVEWGKGNGGWGAWQIVGRYDFLSLSDNAFNDAGGCRNSSIYPGVNVEDGPASARIAQCGEQKTWIIGLNWYLNDYTKLQLNYSESELSDYPVTTIGGDNTIQFPAGTSVAGFDGAKIRGLGLRAHIDW